MGLMKSINLVLPKKPMLIPYLANPARIGRRSLIVVGLYFLGVANGLTDRVVNSIATEGILTALINTFDVSVVVIIAAITGLKLATRTPDQAINRLDWLVVAVYLLGLCLPRSFASMAALTFFAIWEGIRSRHSAAATAAASLFVGISVCLLWGKVALQLFALPILGADAALVANLLSVLQGDVVEYTYNVVNTARGQSLIILPPCSSLSNISYGLLCWMTVIRASRPSWQTADLAMVPVIVVGIILLNVLRMTLMGFSREFYLFIHGSAGTNVTNCLILILAITAAWHTLGRAPAPVFQRRSNNGP